MRKILLYSFAWLALIIGFPLFLRTFFIEAYTIPTGSMENTLQIGDYLIVSKFHYGARAPITPLSLPFMHNTIPVVGTKSYSDAIQLPFFRFPGLSAIKRNDLVVFNWPMQQTRPVDKRDNYIKRCVGLPGDTLQITDGTLFINGKKAFEPAHLQYRYIVQTDGSRMNPRKLAELGIDEAHEFHPGAYWMFLTNEQVHRIKKLPTVKSVERNISPKGDVQMQRFYFPPDVEHFKWNPDNYGPVVIPAKGATVFLNASNRKMYEGIISRYEQNTLEFSGEKIFINGLEADSYTFRMNYYWMMGDNRHNSEDSRFWGMVPEDHINGKAWMLWRAKDAHAGFIENESPPAAHRPL